MNDNLYTILKRLFDLIILLLIVVIIFPYYANNKKNLPQDSPHAVAEPLIEKAKAINKNEDTSSEISKTEIEELLHIRSENKKIKTTKSDSLEPKIVMQDEHDNTNIENSLENQTEYNLESEKILDDKQENTTQKTLTLKEKNPEKKEEKITENTEPKTNKIWIKIGVFNNQEKLNTVLNKIKKQGLKYKIDRLGKFQVLKVGPLNAQEMNNAIDKIKKIGISNWVRIKE